MVTKFLKYLIIFLSLFFLSSSSFATQSLDKNYDSELNKDKDYGNAIVTNLGYLIFRIYSLQYQGKISRFFSFATSIGLIVNSGLLGTDLTLRVNPFGKGLKGVYVGPKSYYAVYNITQNSSLFIDGVEFGFEGMLGNFVLNLYVEGLRPNPYTYRYWFFPSLRIGYAW